MKSAGHTNGAQRSGLASLDRPVRYWFCPKVGHAAEHSGFAMVKTSTVRLASLLVVTMVV